MNSPSIVPVDFKAEADLIRLVTTSRNYVFIGRSTLFSYRLLLSIICYSSDGLNEINNISRVLNPMRSGRRFWHLFALLVDYSQLGFTDFK